MTNTNASGDCNCKHQETFAVQLKLPHGRDPSMPCNYDPKCTIGIGIEVIIGYDCDAKPHLVPGGTTITGLNQVGFVVSSEYEVVPYVEQIKTIRNCSIPDCQKSIQYQFDIKFYIYLVVGVGFGFGSGFFAFGTAGFKTKSNSETATFTTKCICCDD